MKPRRSTGFRRRPSGRLPVSPSSWSRFERYKRDGQLLVPDEAVGGNTDAFTLWLQR